MSCRKPLRGKTSKAAEFVKRELVMNADGIPPYLLQEHFLSVARGSGAVHMVHTKDQVVLDSTTFIKETIVYTG